MEKHSLMSAIIEGGPITLFIFFFLVLLSFISWGVIFAKGIQFIRVRRDDNEFLQYFQETKSLQGLYNHILSIEKKRMQGLFFLFDEAYAVINSFEKRTPDLNFSDPKMQILKRNLQESVNRALTRARTIEYKRKDAALAFLATCSNVAPFIGLLGTVVGIINAFRVIGEMGSADLAFIAPAISEALVATGMGLFVAIPASMAFNYFKAYSGGYRDDYNNFSLVLQNKIQDSFLSGG